MAPYRRCVPPIATLARYVVRINIVREYRDSDLPKETQPFNADEVAGYLAKIFRGSERIVTRRSFRAAACGRETSPAALLLQQRRTVF